MTPTAVAVLGASGYTGIECIRILLRHPRVVIAALGTASNDGVDLGMLAPNLAVHRLPVLQTAENIQWSAAGIEVVFSCLPHGELHKIIAKLPADMRIIDLSADFRLKDASVFEQWYQQEHGAPDRCGSAVYGLTEIYRQQIASAQLVACPGCYPTAVLLATLPLVQAGIVRVDDVLVDAKSGISGAGRGLKQNTAFCEAGESISPYAIGGHRHVPEMEQELSLWGNAAARLNFLPHLVPMSRGELVSVYLTLRTGHGLEDALAALDNRYRDEPFVQVVNGAEMHRRAAASGIATLAPPQTVHVRGSNLCQIGVYPTRHAGKIVVIAAIDNIGKGSAGQAVQNFNVMHGLPEVTALENVGMFP